MFGQLQQQAQRFVGYAVLGVVEVESGCFDRQALAAFGVSSKELAEMQAVDLLKMGGQGLPGRKLGDRFRGRCHSSLLLTRHGGLRSLFARASDLSL
jgi:hypothetical protein